MEILHFTPECLSNIYTIQGRILASPTESAWLGSMQGLLAPGERTQCHAHHDQEQFVIIAGKGIVANNHQQVKVKSGDVIRFKAGESHTLINDSSKENLVFFSMWWASSQGAVIDKQAPINLTAPKQILIAPPATPNGDLHLGHLAGPYLAADILRRFLQQSGHSVCYITGSDDNQSYVSLKAAQLKRTQHSICDYFAENIQQVLAQYQAKPDLFYRPLNDQDYTAFIKAYFIKLYEKNAIRPHQLSIPYCESCQQWLIEADLSGYCAMCNNSCGGGSCETCAMPNDGTQLTQSFCKYCRNTPTFRFTEVLGIDLQEYANPLKSYLNQLQLPTHIRALVRQLFDQPLPIIAVSHPGNWGIAVPISGFEHQTFCTWSEMAPAYLYGVTASSGINSQQISQRWVETWNDSNTQITLLFGYDNSFFYAVLVPALLLAYDKTIKLPEQFVYNEFYLFEQNKFSTSRDHAVWAHEIIQQVSSDYLRYYLAATRPEVERSNFSYSEFVSLINQDLATDLSGWITQLAQRINQDFHGICPDGGQWQIEHTEFCEYLQHFLNHVAQAYSASTFSPATLVRLLREFIIRAKKLSSGIAFLSKTNSFNQLEYQTSIVLELTAVKYYALASFAIMPDYALNLANALGLSTEKSSTPMLIWENELRLIPKGRKITRLEDCVFAKLDITQLLSASNDSHTKLTRELTHAQSI